MLQLANCFQKISITLMCFLTLGSFFSRNFIPDMCVQWRPYFLLSNISQYIDLQWSKFFPYLSWSELYFGICLDTATSELPVGACEMKRNRGDNIGEICEVVAQNVLTIQLMEAFYSRRRGLLKPTSIIFILLRLGWECGTSPTCVIIPY